MEINNDWFEQSELGGRRSKFCRPNFIVPIEHVEAQWRSWTPDERRMFAWAFGFSARVQLTDNDQRLLDFLMENGGQEVWSAIGNIVGAHRDRDRALNFFLARIKEGLRPLGNYYQGLARLSAPESVPTLREVLAREQREVDQLAPSLRTSADQDVYRDCIHCSLTLFVITKEREYLTNLKKMLEHTDESVRQMVRTATTLWCVNLD
jgi:hypothetical protein